MVIFGITGGSGAGKTTALHALASMGAYVLDCDAVYHELLDSSRDMQNELGAAFGNTIIKGEDGIDRKALGEIVFENEDKMNKLNQITHPYLSREISKRIAAAQIEGKKVAAIDAIRIFESGLNECCTYCVGVLAPRENRISRIMQRDGIDRKYAEARINSQQPDEFYREKCDYILENNYKTEEEFFQYSKTFFNDILNNKQEEGPKMEETKQVKESKQSAKRDQLIFCSKNGYDKIDENEKAEMEQYCEDYKKFLNICKTERECTDYLISFAEAKGFRPYTKGMSFSEGDRIYCDNRGKSLMLAVIGTENLDMGINICAAHIDSPRLDIKPKPVYEDSEMAFLKTHYYGGLRKYQWVTIPLELHGIVVLKNGDSVNIAIGNNEKDPVFTIDDLLPHLAVEQSKKPLSEAIPAESLNILIGSIPFKNDEGGERVKLNILDILNKRYGITEEDFLSAELCAVPNFKARDIGFDRSMIGAYGQDDRVCAFPAFRALLNLDTPKRTAVCVLADKEEIGSMGVSGMQSKAFDTFISDLCDQQNVKLSTCFANSFCLSADVTAAYDPNFPDVFEKNNSAYINYGIGVCKYTGARGKSGCNDAPAEVVGYIRRIFDKNKVLWQLAELGKADAGGGGTVALFMANRNIDTIDAGVPVLSMHSPYETVSKLDCYMTYKAMDAVYTSEE